MPLGVNQLSNAPKCLANLACKAFGLFNGSHSFFIAPFGQALTPLLAVQCALPMAITLKRSQPTINIVLVLP